MSDPSGAFTFHEQADDGSFGITISGHGRDVLITTIDGGENVAGFAVSPVVALFIADAIELVAHSLAAAGVAPEPEQEQP